MKRFKPTIIIISGIGLVFLLSLLGQSNTINLNALNSGNKLGISNLTNSLSSHIERVLTAQLLSDSPDQSFILSNVADTVLSGFQKDLIATLQNPNEGFTADVDGINILISPDQSLEYQKEFVNQNTLLVEKHFAQNNLPTDVETQLNKAVDSAELAGKIASAYSALINDALLIPVPSSWLDIAKERLLMFINLKEIFEKISMIDQDPVKAIIGIKRFQVILRPLVQSEINMYQKLKELGIN